MFDYWGFMLKGNCWNNIFWYQIDVTQELRVPFLKEVRYDDLEKNWIILWNIPVFSEVNDSWTLQFYTWLDNFYYFEWNWIPIYLFDNHNHAFAFWWREVLKWVIRKWLWLLHIDQHSDMNENEFHLENETWEDIVSFTNKCCNVWNFIHPAMDCWLVWEVKQLRTEQWLLCFTKPRQDYILDIDLDYWDENMGITDFQCTINKVKILAWSARMVTIATSPYFLNQKRAIELVKELFF